MTFEQFIRDSLQPHILPAYRTPYPGDGMTSIPRSIHGIMHVCRSLMFVEVLNGAWQELLGTRPCDLFAVRHAVAWHDAGREGDGTNIWERDSARLAARDILERYRLPPEYARYIGGLIIKPFDPGDPNALLTTAVDCLEIMRLTGRDGFNRSLFPWLHRVNDPFMANQPLEVLRQALKSREILIEEADHWIASTQQSRLMARLEPSPRYFEELMELFEGMRDLLPTLSRYLPPLAGGGKTGSTSPDRGP
ncbi:MAG: hypothetical protein HY319_01005 [Armatimonadetes bacterium]|nr:hypothetical protein [Armatimonadota bacterium]